LQTPLLTLARRFQIRIQTSTNLTRQFNVTARRSDISASAFSSNLGTRSQMYNLISASRLPSVTFVPRTDSGFVLLLQPIVGDRFQVSAGMYRLALALTMAEVGANVERLVSVVAGGYVRIELVDLDSPAPLDADWFASDAATGLGQDASGKWVATLQGSSKPLVSALSFAAIRISFVFAAAQGSVARLSASPVTVTANPLASLTVTYVLG
jgi:hypothetical protein